VFPLGAAAELTAYRIVQEALTNTLRHAAARHAAVTVTYDEPELRIRVADDGVSAGPGGPGHGILADLGDLGHGVDGMRERAALHHGSLRAGPADGGGWLVEAIIRPRAARTDRGVPA
jgi:signal transduction histidine kinase